MSRTEKDEWGNRSPAEQIETAEGAAPPLPGRGGAVVYREPWRSWFWRKLGFGWQRTEATIGEHMDWRYSEMDGYAESSMETETIAHFDWKDRIRILVSGTVQVNNVLRTDVVVKRLLAKPQVAVMPPGYRLIGRHPLAILFALLLSGCALFEPGGDFAWLGNPFETEAHYRGRLLTEDAAICQGDQVCMTRRHEERVHDELVNALRNGGGGYYAAPLYRQQQPSLLYDDQRPQPVIIPPAPYRPPAPIRNCQAVGSSVFCY